MSNFVKGSFPIAPPVERPHGPAPSPPPSIMEQPRSAGERFQMIDDIMTEMFDRIIDLENKLYELENNVSAKKPILGIAKTLRRINVRKNR